MTATVSRVDDPRDALEKTPLQYLEKFVKQNGLNIPQGTPAIAVRAILRGMGIHSVPGAPRRVLGQTDPISISGIPDAMPAPLIAAQPIAPVQKSAEGLSFNDLRAVLKARGVKLSRTDTLEVLREKFRNVQNAS